MTDASALARGEDEKLDLWSSIPFFAAHAVAIVAPFFLPFSWKLVGLAVLLYYARMAGDDHRLPPLCLAPRVQDQPHLPVRARLLGGDQRAEGHPLVGPRHHRNHHKYSDQPEDVHSPQRGFWWSHMGGSSASATPRPARSRTSPAIPSCASSTGSTCSLRCCSRPAVPRRRLVVAGVGLSFVSTVLLWHGTFVVNSLNHVWGSRRYATTDTSRNNAVLALLTMGEGWHNNHHHYMSSANQGFFWWNSIPATT